MSSSNSPCAACKCLRRKCTQECVFAPYFPPDNPQKFTNVHKVFGASNISKLLNELPAAQREDAVNSLAYEADYRLRDPVYGCVGLISILQHKLKQVHHDLEAAKKELATYIGPSAMLPIINHPGFAQQHSSYGQYQMVPYNVQPMMGLPTGIPHGAQLMIREPQQQQQQQQFLEAQQIAAREQELMRTYESHQDEMMRFNGGFEEGGGPVTATGFNQMGGANMQQTSLALGSTYETIPYHHIQQQEEQAHLHHLNLLQQQQNATTSHQQEPELLPQAQASLTQQQTPRATSEEDRRTGPSC